MAAARTRAGSKGEEHGSEGRTGRGGPGSLLPLMRSEHPKLFGPFCPWLAVPLSTCPQQGLPWES